ncbi:MAG: PKD domain-containing protein [Thermoplasmatota archaeon]
MVSMADPFLTPVHEASAVDHETDGIYISGWTFPWDEPTRTSIRDYTGILDDVSPYWYWVMPNGTILPTHNETEDPDLIHFCLDNDIGLVPMISNNHDPQTVVDLIHNSTMQQKHIQDLVGLVRRLFYKGIDINYEEVPAAEKDGYSSFIGNLTKEFHKYGKEVHVSVFPKVSADENREGPGAYDYETLGAIADRIRVMAYNLHWSTVEYAGPITAQDWLEVVLAYATTAIPPGKVTLGVAQYGYDWRVGKNHRTLGIADNISYGDVVDLMRTHNLQRYWNSSSRTPYLLYRDRNGENHEVHYCDAESLMHQLKLVTDLSIGGISIWKIGGEDPDVSTYLRNVQNSSLKDLPPFIDIQGDITGMRGADMDFGPVRAYDIEGTLTNIQWDFGDGKTSALLEPVHRYERGGFYTATLTVEDDGGNVVRFSRNIQIGPYSMFEVEGDLLARSIIGFNGTLSWDPEGIVSYSWDLGDGTYLFHSSPRIDHLFSRPGNYDVSLTVINTRGYSDTSTLLIEIPDTERPRAVDLEESIVIWEGSYLILDSTGSYDNSGSMNYTWSLGVLGTFHTSSVRIFMERPGKYSGFLKVTDRSGLYDIEEFDIIVRDRTPPILIVDHPGVVRFGDEVRLSISSSSDNVGIENITWNLGQGRIIYDKVNISFTPSFAGKYYITVDVLDGEGNWNSTTVVIDVRDMKPPAGDFHIDPTPRSMNSTYLPGIKPDIEEVLPDLYGVILYNTTYIFSLVNASDDSGIANITWWFGDGERAGGPVVYHEYTLPGVYQAILDIEDIWGNRYQVNITLLAIVSWNQTVNEIWTYVDVYINNTVYVEPEVEDDGGPMVDIVPWIISIAIAVVFIVSFTVVFSMVREQIRLTRKSEKKGGDKDG